MANGGPSTKEHDLAGAFLEFFYPIHYQVGKALEDAMRGGQLTRKQAVILWIIHAEGREGRQMRRKDIQRLIEGWFEISSPAMTQALRAMARPPLQLVRLTEAPHSGREQMVSLTPKGERFLAAMIEHGKQRLRPVLAVIPENDLRAILSVFQRNMARAVQQLQLDPAVSLRDGNPRTAKPAKPQRRHFLSGRRHGREV